MGPAAAPAVDHAELHADEPRNRDAACCTGRSAPAAPSYFAAKSDLSTLLEDLALVRPTQLIFVPRIWDMLFQEFQRELDRRSSDGADRAAVEAEVMAEQRQNLLGGRFVFAHDRRRADLRRDEGVRRGLPRHASGRNGYGSTEAGIVFVDGQVQTPAGDRLQAGRRTRPGLFPHRSAIPAGRGAGHERIVVPGLLQAAGASPPKCSTPTATTGLETSWPSSGPISCSMWTAPPTCSSFRTGRFRHSLQAGSGVRRQPADLADLHLRQQRTPLPARSGRAH